MRLRWIDDIIEDYRERLHRSEVSDFDHRLEEEKSKLETDEIRTELENKYEREEDHLDLIRAGASAFNQTPLADGHESGYEFAFTEPLIGLTELGLEEEATTGDLVLVKEPEDKLHAYLCIIDCKSGRGDGSWITELREIKKTTESNLDRLKTQLGIQDKEVRDIQYMILGKMPYVHGFNYSTLEEKMEVKEDFAFLGCDMSEFLIGHVNGTLKDDSLASVVNDVLDALKIENPIKFTYSDHPLLQIKEILSEIMEIQQDTNDEEPLEFNREMFGSVFEDGLQMGMAGQPLDNLVNRRVDRLLDICLRIEILVEESRKMNTSRDFRIYFKGEKRHVAKSAADTKYFDFMAVEKVKSKAFEEVRDEFDPKPRQVSLSHRFDS